jgi:hypothetical protein
VRALGRVDDCASFLQDEEAGARISALDQRLARCDGELRGARRQDIQLLVVEIREQQERAEALSH